MMDDENATRLIAAVVLHLSGIVLMAGRPGIEPEDAVDLAARAWVRANETAQKATL